MAKIFIEQGKVTDDPSPTSTGNVRVSIQDGDRFTAFVEEGDALASVKEGDIVDLAAQLRVNRSNGNVYLNLASVEGVQRYTLKKVK